MKDYKQIWNNLSTDFRDASFFVCCISDEDEIRSNGAITAEFLRSVLQIEQTDKVLEIGCGVARIGRELAASCGEWCGVDISGNMITYAKERTAGIDNVYLFELPDNSLRIFPDNTFDCVYSSIVFMHLDKPEVFAYLREAQRVLKPGGRAYFDTYNLLAPDGWQIFLDLVNRFTSGERPGHVSQFSTPEEVRKYMTEAGFTDVHTDDQNRQLVVMLGRKAETSGAASGPASLADLDIAETVPTSAATNEAGDAGKADNGQPTAVTEQLRDDGRQLQAELDRRFAYVQQLEAEIARKNAALTKLESRLRRWERRRVWVRLPRLRGSRRAQRP